MVRDWNGWYPGEPLLNEKIAAIAGGAHGIGAATTRILAEAGAAVAVIDSNSDNAKSIADEIRSAGGRALAVAADLRDEQDCHDSIEQVVDQLGGLDILVNVAGGLKGWVPWAPVRDWTTESWDLIIHMNLRYIFWLCRSVLPALERRGGGAIVNVTSVAGLFASPNQSAYGAAKAGLIQLTKTLAVECGRYGIRVNAISPHAVMGSDFGNDERATAVRSLLGSKTPLGRTCIPEDVARAALFFASPIAEYVTGQMLVLDGGVSVKFPFTPGADPSEAHLV